MQKNHGENGSVWIEYENSIRKVTEAAKVKVSQLLIISLNKKDFPNLKSVTFVTEVFISVNSA